MIDADRRYVLHAWAQLAAVAASSQVLVFRRRA